MKLLKAVRGRVLNSLSRIFLIFLLINMVSTLKISRVEAWRDHTITIKGDGSIDPPDAPVKTYDGVTYVLTDDIWSSGSGIVVKRSNIVIDGKGLKIEGSRTGIGIDVFYNINITIRNVTIKGFYYGISLYSLSRDNKIIGSRITDCYEGMIVDSSGTQIVKNNLTDNIYGITLYSSNNNVTENRIIENLGVGLYVYGSSNNISGNIIMKNGRGISLGDSQRNRIVKNTVVNNGVGVYLQYSSFNEIAENNVTGNRRESICLFISPKNNITGNIVANNGNGIDVTSENNNIIGNSIVNNRGYITGCGLRISSSNNRIIGNSFIKDGLYVGSPGNIAINNTVNGKPLVYLEGASDITIQNAGQVILVGCSRIKVKNLNLSHTFVGVLLLRTNDMEVSKNIMMNNTNGVLIYKSSKNNITENRVENISGSGIYLRASSGNRIVENKIKGTGGISIYLDGSFNNSIIGNDVMDSWSDGICLYVSSNNSVLRNNIVNNMDSGIALFYSSFNEIAENNVENNLYGINLRASSNNRICHNSFISNKVKNDYPEHINVWDDGYPSGGNYWSNYEGQDANDDGIGDTPYVIDENNRDTCPLMRPYGYFVKILTSYGTASGSGFYRSGENVTISLSQTIVDYGNETRSVFIGWYENGYLIDNRRSFSILVNKSRIIVANWDIEYEVKVFSERGTATGSGWYISGSDVNISISPIKIDKDFFSYYVFEGWKTNGETISFLSNYSFIADKPMTLIASWRTELNAVNIGIIVGAVLLIIIIATPILRKYMSSSHR